MKNIMLRHNRRISAALVAVCSAILIAGTISAAAYNGNGNGYNNQNGYYNNGHYYPYSYHNHHRGYWNQSNSGVRVWISI